MTFNKNADELNLKSRKAERGRPKLHDPNAGTGHIKPLQFWVILGTFALIVVLFILGVIMLIT